MNEIQVIEHEQVELQLVEHEQVELQSHEMGVESVLMDFIIKVELNGRVYDLINTKDVLI